MSSPSKASNFPVGPAGKKTLRRALVRATDPAGTIQTFQQNHSLHSMMARAFGTTPRHEMRKTRSAEQQTQESLDTDSVMTFLSHLGVSHYEVHKKISDTLVKQLEDEIRKSKSKEKLLDLLQSCWTYATTLQVPELRRILWAVLKQLGEETPLPALTHLAERDEDGKLKHEEIFEELSPLLKRLCWEADWDARIPLEPDLKPKEHLDKVKSTLLFDTIGPLLDLYCHNKMLTDAANRPFVATMRERRMLTKQRRALTASAVTTAAPSKPKTVLRGGTAPPTTQDTLTSGKAVSKIRDLLCDSAGSASTFRPKLLYALLSILMAQHGAHDTTILAGAEHLHCTLVADILLSAGGPLPKAYQYVLTLARVLDECVQEGNISDAALARVQSALKLIFQPEEAEQPESPKKDGVSSSSNRKDALSNPVQRQLNRIITSGLAAMKDEDPRNVFLNPVTDAIAPGYSRVIKKPMSIITMEKKVERNKYNNVADWEADVKLMFKNCIDYNKGNNGQWFRGEANRQRKVFSEEIFPQARRLYQNEIAKRSVTEDATSRKRKAGEGDGPEIKPLPSCSKKRKKDKEEYLPSMPALASMLLADPFVVRIIMARVLRELRRGVLNGASLPAAHSVVPSLLQLLHMARWSGQMCAVRGKRYFIPPSGLQEDSNPNDPSSYVPFSSLRQYVPLLLRLFLEAEVDRRVGLGGDLNAAAQSASIAPDPLVSDSWKPSDQMEVVVSLIEGALVFLCQPGHGNETSLTVSFPKFALALQRLSASLLEDHAFFLCLNHVLLLHRSKLPKSTRDAIVDSWHGWLRHKEGENGSVTSNAHLYLIKLLNEWSALGNLLLPRDTLFQFCIDTVKAVDSSATKENTFAQMWKSDASEFAPIKEQYERMLKHLPASQAEQWKEQVGVDDVGQDSTGAQDEKATAEEATEEMAD